MMMIMIMIMTMMLSLCIRGGIQQPSWQAALPDGLVDSGSYRHEASQGVFLLHVSAVPLLLCPTEDDSTSPRRHRRPQPAARAP